MRQDEMDQILAGIAYADAMQNLGVDITRIGIPILETGTVVGMNFYKTYRGKAILELNPLYIWKAWTLVWLEYLEGDWVFDQSSYREELFAQYFPENFPEPRAVSVNLKVVPEKMGVKIVDIPL